LVPHGMHAGPSILFLRAKANTLSADHI